MSNNFDWQTEEDAHWEENLAVRPTEDPPRRSWRWLGLLLVVGLLVLAGGLVWRQVNEQLAQTQNRLAEEVLSSHNLVQRAAADGDEDLLTPLLSGRDPEWVAAQKALMARRDFWGQAAWRLEPEAVQPYSLAESSVTLNSRLDTAVLVVTPTYQLADGTPVQLQQTAVYRQGAGRWLWSPPDDEFWGDWVTAETDVLKANFPARDEEVVQRLLTDLTGVLEQLCAWDSGACLEAPLALRFDTHPAALAAVGELEAQLSPGVQIELPTPTLVGLPVDDAGYEALWRGYGALVATAVLARQSGYDCCEHGIYFAALTAHLLAELELQPWPLQTADYAELLLTNGLERSFLDAMYRLDRLTLTEQDRTALLDERAVFAFVQFLGQELAVPALPVEMGRELAQNRSMESWVVRITSERADLLRQENVLHQFAVAQAANRAAELPVALPGEPLMAYCSRDFRDQWEYVLFDLAQGTAALAPVDASWNEVRPFFQQPLSGTGAELVHVAMGEVYATYLRRGEEQVYLNDWFGEQGVPLVDTGLRSGDGRYAVLVGARQESDRPNRLALLDVAGCTTESCPLPQLTGAPLWSPDSAHTLLMDENGMPIFSLSAVMNRLPGGLHLALGNGRGEVLRDVGMGYAPFWLADERYGYVRWRDAEPEMVNEIVVAAVADGEPETLITVGELAALLPEGDADLRAQVVIGAVAQVAETGDLLVTLTRAPWQWGAVFQVQLAGDGTVAAVEHLATVDFVPNVLVGGNGRWAVIEPSYNEVSDELGVLLISLEEPDVWRELPMQPIYQGMTTWSPDGQWYVQIERGFVALYQPDADDYQIVPHEFRECFQAEWW